MLAELIEIEDAVETYKKLKESLDFIKNNYVLVGIPQKETKREKEEVTNAELLFIHTNGSPINNIPARPVIEPALKDDKERIAKMQKQAMLYVLDGDKDGAYNELEKLGMRGQNVCRKWFLDPKNGWPPNSPAVQAEKRRKGAENPRPLIDTGELRKSITYVIVKNGGRVK